ncbi:NADH-quinone oxidoreductase subunit G [Alphaproteobacteria bacterium]|nr:NADH-quinone oxidoreductase subunit G [Alphaproteobacteria bacterium]
MPTISINGKSQIVPEGITVIQACEIADIEIPRFCYHERLAIAGNCRMCLVEVAGGPPKPVASCAMNVTEGMQIFTDTPMVKKAREGVMEFLLANHPLDCPICDQGGECDLQDQAYQYGKGKSDYHEHKRAVKDKNMGVLIKTQMTRCIHCTRCVRFVEDIAGTCEIGAVGRGENMEITSYLEKNIKSELSGNVIDLCPVGALTSKPYAFKARSWELKKTNSIDVMDALGSNIRIDSRGIEVMRILPIINEEINEEWLSDKARFCYDGLKYQRLDNAYLKENNKLTKTTYQQVIKEIANKIKNLKSDEIAGLSGQLASVEDIFALKSLLEKLGSKNFDCRLQNQKLSNKNPASYLFNSTISGIDNADLILLVGVNPRKDAPVLNARIRKRYLSRDCQIFSVGLGNNPDLTYPYQNLGNDLITLKQIAEGKHQICDQLKSAKKPMLIIGNDAVSGDNGEMLQHFCQMIAHKFNFIQNDFNGYNFLAQNSGLINGLELGFDQTTTQEILDKCENNKIKLLFLLEVDDNIDFDKLKDVFVVYIGSHGDKGASNAGAIIPATAFSEKEAFYINIEGRVQSTRRAVFAPQNAQEDWQIFLDLAREIECDLGFKDHLEIRQKIIINFPNLAKIDQANPRLMANDNLSNPSNFVNQLIAVKDYDFYLTNAITRASRTLNKCSTDNKNN